MWMMGVSLLSLVLPWKHASLSLCFYLSSLPDASMAPLGSQHIHILGLKLGWVEFIRIKWQHGKGEGRTREEEGDRERSAWHTDVLQCQQEDYLSSAPRLPLLSSSFNKPRLRWIKDFGEWLPFPSPEFLGEILTANAEVGKKTRGFFGNTNSGEAGVLQMLRKLIPHAFLCWRC